MIKNENKIVVSVVMPVYNEGDYIVNCIESLLKQDYPKEKMEWIFVDGNSTDDTKAKISFYEKKEILKISLLDNKKKTVPYSMNIGIEKAIGKYIIRLDAHAHYEFDYISKCVYYLDKLNVDNVGGLIKTVSKGGYIGDSIADMLSSKFGVGNSSFRTNGNEGYVDTVPFGAFKKDVFKRVGKYDERLTRNQDNELNYRIRKNGGKIFLARDIKAIYYCRNKINSILKMGMTNGMWNVITMKLCPGSMGIRHFVPAAFVISILIASLLGLFFEIFKQLLWLELLLYFLMAVIFAVKDSSKMKHIPMLVILFFLFHVSYGIGSLIGIVKQREYK